MEVISRSTWQVVLFWLSMAAGVALPQESVAPPVRYMVVVTGGELLAGAYADGHTFFLTRTLRPLGLQCIGSMAVDDRAADLKDALRFAADRAGLVIVTGGLGPTDNDITRETLRDFTGIALREHPDVLVAMARRFNVPPDQLRTNLRRQTHTPERGTYLKNAGGTAVGLVFEMDDRVVVALPGPPRELQPMVRDELVPYLSRRFGVRPPGASITLRFVGLGQSQIDQTLKDHVPLPDDVTTGSQFEGGRVDFTFSLPQDTPEDRARLAELGDKIAQHLGAFLFARDATTSLETCVMQLLEMRGETIALAEVGTGGALAAALNGAQGTHEVLIGAYIAPTTERLHQMLGGPRRPGETAAHTDDVERLAQEAAAIAGSRWVVATGESLRDAMGNCLVPVVFRSPDGRVESRQIPVSGTADAARARLVTELLDQLRCKLR
ncbi:MAG: CinA family protein [Phycisphaerae bacterium]|nr:CinA family protein [Phycisphaerae bacterium]